MRWNTFWKRIIIFKVQILWEGQKKFHEMYFQFHRSSNFSEISRETADAWNKNYSFRKNFTPMCRAWLEDAVMPKNNLLWLLGAKLLKDPSTCIQFTSTQLGTSVEFKKLLKLIIFFGRVHTKRTKA